MNVLDEKQTTTARGRQDSQELILEDTHYGTQEPCPGNLPNRFVSDSQDLALGFRAKDKFCSVRVICEVEIMHIFVGCQGN